MWWVIKLKVDSKLSSIRKLHNRTHRWPFSVRSEVTCDANRLKEFLNWHQVTSQNLCWDWVKGIARWRCIFNQMYGCVARIFFSFPKRIFESFFKICLQSFNTLILQHFNFLILQPAHRLVKAILTRPPSQLFFLHCSKFWG